MLIVFKCEPDELFGMVVLDESQYRPHDDSDDCEHCGEPTGRAEDPYVQNCAFCGNQMYR